MIIQSGEIQMMSHHSLEMGRMRRFQHKTSEVVLTPEERGQKAAQLGQNLQNFNTADSDETAEDGFLTVLNYRLDDAAAGNASEETDGMQVSATKKSALDRLMEGKSHEQRMQTLGYLLLQILYGRISGNYDMDLNTAAQDYLQQST